MLESRYMSANRKFQGVRSEFYTTTVTVLRKVVADGHTEFDGSLGDSDIRYRIVTKNYPASIVHKVAELKTVGAAETEKGDYILTAPFKMLSDNKLLIRSRDIVVDMSNQDQYYVLHSEDPMHTRIQIQAKLELGTTTVNIEDQG